MTQIVSRFTDNPVENFLSLVMSLVRGVSWRIKKDTKEGKSDNPLADVEGVCSFQFAAYCRCHAPNAQRYIYWQMNTIFSRAGLWIQRLQCLEGKRGFWCSESLLERSKVSHHVSIRHTENVHHWNHAPSAEWPAMA